MKHFVLIRMNLNSIFKKLDIDSIIYRLELFKSSTLISLNNQTDKNFIPVLVADPNIPDSIKEEYKKTGCRIIWLDNKNRSHNSLDYKLISKKIRKWLGKSQLLITTNIDSDDIMNPNHIKNINDLIKDLDIKELPIQISEEKNSYYIGKNTVYKKEWKTSNNAMGSMLYSFLEKDNIKTCLVTAHGGIKRFAKKRIFINSPFIQICHISNISSRVDNIEKKKLKISVEELLLSFNFSLEEITDLNNFLNKNHSKQFIEREKKLRESYLKYKKRKKTNG
jgi:hypothetical protein